MCYFSPSDDAQEYQYLLEGELVEFQRLARADNSQWLIDVAHVKNLDISSVLLTRGILFGRWCMSIVFPFLFDSPKLAFATTSQKKNAAGVAGTMGANGFSPKRMGDGIYHLTIFDPLFGISLISTLDAKFALYKIGLKQTDGSYEAHDFTSDALTMLALE
ncbi:hypothetical protein BT96DRAFT_946601 [Gymnopus androsaceus JB14]|uniref:Uncharacterized protein n=1 Tax=Gymnopus androsaceus JB14 TaxID=1447944 RepID=A0A6A4GWJ1_9AGAR|nr:hypothetical protein BT96DRAFT_946601 [Gymnopus androsaceus JB14]